MSINSWMDKEDVVHTDTHTHTHTHKYYSAIKKEWNNVICSDPLQCSCLEDPRDAGAWWAAVYGVAQSRARQKWLSSSSMLTEISQTGKDTYYMTVAPTFFSTRDWFHGRQFFHRWGLGDHFGMIQTHYLFCACYFYYYINSTSASGIRSQSLGGPCYMISLTCGVPKKANA